MCTHTQIMTTKTISITEDIYERLKAIKTEDESFSEELKRLTETKGSIMEFAGSWNDIGEEDANRIKGAIREMRKGTRLDEIKRNVV